MRYKDPKDKKYRIKKRKTDSIKLPLGESSGPKQMDIDETLNAMGITRIEERKLTERKIKDEKNK